MALNILHLKMKMASWMSWAVANLDLRKIIELKKKKKSLHILILFKNFKYANILGEKKNLGNSLFEMKIIWYNYQYNIDHVYHIDHVYNIDQSIRFILLSKWYMKQVVDWRIRFFAFSGKMALFFD